MNKPTQHDIEAEVLTAVLAGMQAWAQQGAEAIERFLAYIAEDFTGFGTGPGDYVPNRDALRMLTQREQEYLVYPFTIGQDWVNVRVLHPTLALAEAEFNMDVQTDTDTLVLTVRCSTLLERRNDQWLVIHAHYSLPDAMQGVAGTLMEALKARNQELEREVARRTAELKQSLDDLKAAQARLVQQEKMASLGALTAGIAHEIKNPLNFINNFAALSRELVDELEEGTDPGESKALLADLKTNAEKIEKHGRRADGIIRSMLEHSRGSSGQRRAIDLNALVAKYVDLGLHGKCAQTVDFNVEIAKDFDATVGQVDVVPQDIGRVLLNLFGNAFDAVYEQAQQAGRSYSPRVVVTTRLLEGQVEIRVTDNGPGIPETVGTKIFEPFFTTKPTGSGTGLGLSLSYDIITQGHGGTLTVDSEEDRGATFIVTLPLNEDRKPDANLTSTRPDWQSRSPRD